MVYLSFKWLHIVAVISWMAGLLYLFRLFIYHRKEGDQSNDNHRLLQVMERRLYRFITTPAMLTAWFAGLSMIYLNPGLMKGGWMHTKLTLVLLLSGLTGYAGSLVRRFQEQGHIRRPTERALRWINEIPTVLMILIVGLVIFRP